MGRLHYLANTLAWSHPAPAYDMLIYRILGLIIHMREKNTNVLYFRRIL